MITLASTTDSPEQVKAALVESGHAVEEVKVDSTAGGAPIEEQKPGEEVKTPEPPAEDKPEGKTAAEPGAADKPEEDEGDEEEARQVPKGVQKRIDKLTRERYMREGQIEEMNRTAEADRKRIKELEEHLQTLQTGKSAAPEADKPEEKPKDPVVAAAEPTIDQYDTFEEYQKRWSEWKTAGVAAELRREMETKVEALEAKLQRQKAEEIQKAETVTQLTEWQKRCEAVKPRYADWAEVTEQAKNVQFAPLFGEAIVESDVGPDIVYHLVKNPEEAERIRKATTVSEKAGPAELATAARLAGKEIARLEYELRAKLDTPSNGTTKPAATTTPRKSAAPAPITPVRAASAAATADPSKMSFKEFNAWRAAGGGK